MDLARVARHLDADAARVGGFLRYQLAGDGAFLVGNHAGDGGNSTNGMAVGADIWAYKTWGSFGLFITGGAEDAG